MQDIVKRLYELAEGKEVEDDDIISALGLERCDDHHVHSDGVADLAALMEESLPPAGHQAGLV